MNAPSLFALVEDEGRTEVQFLTSLGLGEVGHLRGDLVVRLRALSHRLIVFRMDRVHSLDSSGLGLFVALRRELPAARFRFEGLHPQVRHVFDFANLQRYLGLDGPPQDTEDAHAQAARPSPPGPSSREFLVLEGKYFLTDEGVNYCTQKRIPVRDLRPYRSAAVSGFTWSSVNAALLERFVTHGLLAGIELERTEFLSKREPILRLIEVVLTGVVLKRFGPLLKARLRDHEAYRQLVTQGVPPARLRSALQQQAEAWERVKAEVRTRVAPGATGSNRASPLVDLVDDSVWFLLVRGQGTPGGRALGRAVVDAVVAYAGRLDLAGMIALNLMEFLQQAEKAHFLNLAERDQFARKAPESIPRLLADAEFRERLIERAKRQNEMLVMNMSFEGSPRGPGLVVEITVRNKGVAGNSRRHESLTRPKEALPLGGEPGDAQGELGDFSFMNLGAITQLCRDQGIALDVGLTRDERADETVATMTLVF